MKGKINQLIELFRERNVQVDTEVLARVFKVETETVKNWEMGRSTNRYVAGRVRWAIELLKAGKDPKWVLREILGTPETVQFQEVALLVKP